MLLVFQYFFILAIVFGLHLKQKNYPELVNCLKYYYIILTDFFNEKKSVNFLIELKKMYSFHLIYFLPYKTVLQSRYYVHFRANTLGKGMNPLIHPAMG